MENLHGLFFEFSNRSRLNVLLLVAEERMRLSKISEKLDITTSEVSRHLTRLTKAKLLDKDLEQRYGLTPYGESVISFFPALNILLRHRDYFMTHNLSAIPKRYLLNLDVLSTCEFMSGLNNFVQILENGLTEKNEFEWIITDQLFLNYKNCGAPLKDMRLIIPSNEVQRLPRSDGDHESSGLEIRELENVDVTLGLSESVACLQLPDLSGKIDYNVSIIGRDREFLAWSKDVFLHYWGKARPI
jgi:predicted transcriptional regulator